MSNGIDIFRILTIHRLHSFLLELHLNGTDLNATNLCDIVLA